jgi:hypothetical protein
MTTGEGIKPKVPINQAFGRKSTKITMNFHAFQPLVEEDYHKSTFSPAIG